MIYQIFIGVWNSISLLKYKYLLYNTLSLSGGQAFTPCIKPLLKLQKRGVQTSRRGHGGEGMGTISSHFSQDGARDFLSIDKKIGVGME